MDKLDIINRFIAIFILSLLLTNCASEWAQSSRDCGPDYRPGDVCITQGEQWIFIPNEPNGAVREAQRQGFYWGCENCSHLLHY